MPDSCCVPAKYLADIPAGEDAERILAHLLMSRLACHLRLPKSVLLHVAGAIEVLDASRGVSHTIRGTRNARIVRILTTASGLSAPLLLPMIGNDVIVPALDSNTVRHLAALEKSSAGEIAFGDITIDHVRLRLRRTSLVSALKALSENLPVERYAASLEAIIHRCILPPHEPAGPLETADGFFALARGFARQGNHAFARSCLKKARSHIELYAGATNDMAHRHMSESMTMKITDLVGHLGTAFS